jgi:transposase
MIQLIYKHTPRVLSWEIKRTKDEKYKTRLKAILLIKNGKTRKETADALVVSLKSVTEWVKTYNKEGLRGLKSKKTGRPKGKVEWDAEIFKKLAREIDKGRQYWSIPLMQKWIYEEEKKDIPESTLWYRITQIGYSNKSSRPFPYKGDREKQEEFKKGALLK